MRKKWGFILNRKHEQFVVNVVFHAREIPNNSMTFPNNDGGYAFVTSLTHEHVNYKVYNPKFEWAYYELSLVVKGKHM